MAYAKSVVCGVGINDAPYVVSGMVMGKRKDCRFYKTWRDMLSRVYSIKSLEYRPSYIGTSVCPEWRSFMAFRSWMMFQDWIGKQLDKDILKPGNKVYSPEFCCFVSQNVNCLLLDNPSIRGAYPVGVYFDKRRGTYRAQANNQHTGKKKVHLGTFETESQAAKAYAAYKASVIYDVAQGIDDKRISDALCRRSQDLIQFVDEPKPEKEKPDAAE